MCVKRGRIHVTFLFNDLKFLSERKLNLPWGKENILKFTGNLQAMIERSTHAPSPDESATVSDRKSSTSRVIRPYIYVVAVTKLSICKN